MNPNPAVDRGDESYHARRQRITDESGLTRCVKQRAYVHASEHRRQRPAAVLCGGTAGYRMNEEASKCVRRGSYALSGLIDSFAVPTAYAVGYYLTPSGLRPCMRVLEAHLTLPTPTGIKLTVCRLC